MRSYEIVYQPDLPGQSNADGITFPFDLPDPVTISTTGTVLTIPYGAELLSIDATIEGFADSICIPTLQPLGSGSSGSIITDHTAPDPQQQTTLDTNTYLLTIDLACRGVVDVAVTPSPAPVGTAVTLTATATAAEGSEMSVGFTVENAGGQEVVSGEMQLVEGEHDAKTGDVVAELSLDEIGVYEVCVTVSEAADRTSEPACTMLVVYDPSSGFVTGGGWFDSPEGALATAEDVTGRVSFGLVARYQRNGTVPVGNTQFQFHAGNVNFHSTSYDWLVVNQGSSNAQFKGEGRVNGIDGFGFMVWATDAGRDGTDTFRIRISGPDGELVYDNHGSDLGGGNIMVHTPRGNSR